MQAEERLPWSAWRGTRGDGLASDAHPPTTWAPGQERWRTEIEGDGLSSPILVDGQVFLTNARRPDGDLPAAGLLYVLLAVLIWSGSREFVRAGLRKRARALVVWTCFALCWSLALVSDFHWEARGPSGISLALLAGSLAFGRGRVRLFVGCLAVAAACGASLVLPGKVPERHVYLLLSAALIGLHALATHKGLPARANGDHTGTTAAGFAWSGIVSILASVLWDAAFWRETTAQNAFFRCAYLIAPAVGAALSGLLRTRLGRCVALSVFAALIAWLVPGNMLDSPPSMTMRGMSAAPYVGLIVLALALGNDRPDRSRWFPGLLLFTAVAMFASANYLRPGNTVAQELLCFDLDTGELRWRRELFRVAQERLDTYRTSHATPTCCSDGAVVIAHFGNGTAGVELDGTLLWRVERPWFGAAALYGAGVSPLIQDGLAITVQERERPANVPPSEVTAYELETGKQVWRTELPEARSSYCTPIRVQSVDETLLVTASWRALHALAPGDGSVRWSLPLAAEEIVASPVSDGMHVYLSGGEIRGGTFAVRIPTTLDEAPQLAWSARGVRAGCSSPLLDGDRLYVLEENGVLCCLATDSGEVIWEERLPLGEYIASLSASNGLLFATNTEGLTTVVALQDEFRIVGQGEVHEPVLASPALASGVLLLRSSQSLWCFEAPSGPAPMPR